MTAVLGWFLFWTVLVVSIPLQLAGLPGTWLIFADTIVLRLAAGPDTISWQVLLVLAASALTGEVAEFYLAAAGAGKYVEVRGSTIAAIGGGLLGGIAGATFGFGLGALPGAAAGAFAGVFLLALVSGKNMTEAAGAGKGALLGRIKGAVMKLFVALAMVAVLITSLATG